MNHTISPAIASGLLPFILSVAANAATAILVRIAPKRPVPEPVVPAPSPRYGWIGGYYGWNGRAYLWVPAQWVTPPHPRAIWVPPHWKYVAASNAYLFVDGYWR